MSTGQVLTLGLQVAWLTWAVATAVVLRRALRAVPRGRRPWERPTWLVAAMAVALVLGAYAVALRVDSSGLMELTSRGGAQTIWKGTAGKAFVALFAYVTELGPLDIILVSRLFLPLAALVLVGLSATVVRPEPSVEPDRSAGVDVLLASSALLLTASFSFGVLGGFYFWFVPVLVLAVLLALDRFVRAPSAANRIALVFGVGLLSTSRPELMAGGLAVTLVLAVLAWRRRDRALGAMIVALLAVELLLSLQVFGYLFERMRHQPLLMGDDVIGDAPAWHLPLVGARRILASAPRNVLALILLSHAFSIYAARRVVTMIRRRRAEWPELVALTLLVAECLAIGIHRDGFERFVKYGQIVIVPLWYLALRGAWMLEDGRARRRGVIIMTVSALLVFGFAVGFFSSGAHRHSLPEGRTVAAQRADLRLLWRDGPRLVPQLCSAAGGAPEPARVLVIGLDERADDSSTGESERWPLVHQLRNAGCRTATLYPRVDDDLEAVLFGAGGDDGALCRVHAWPEVTGSRGPTHALLTYYRPERGEQLQATLARQPRGDCSYRISNEVPLGSALLLTRVSPSPPAAAAGARGEPAPQ